VTQNMDLPSAVFPWWFADPCLSCKVNTVNERLRQREREIERKSVRESARKRAR